MRAFLTRLLKGLKLGKFHLTDIRPDDLMTLSDPPSSRQFAFEARSDARSVSCLGPDTMADFQRKIIDLLVCPVSRERIEVLPTIVVGDAIKQGVLVSQDLNQTVGRISNFQIDLVRYSEKEDICDLRAKIKSGDLPARLSTEPGFTFKAPSSAIYKFSGDWRPIDGTDLVTDCTLGQSSIHFTIHNTTKIHFRAHPWSGLTEIRLNSRLLETLDLFEPHTSVPRDFVIAVDKEGSPMAVEIRATGRRNEMSMGNQCLFSGCSIQNDTQIPIVFKKKLGVRGAEFDYRFFEILKTVPVAGLVLDIGGGNRQIDDARYVNLDYAPFAEPDIIGDALQLPFKNDAFDFVYSSGVFEHLKDPKKAAEEVFRVTKPGGRILIGIAFMQPIHSEGQHFFNCTVWGIQELFQKFQIDDVTWEGSMSYLVDWMTRCTHIDRLAPAEEIDQVLKTIKGWDALVTPEKLKYIANGVWCLGTKTPKV